NSFKAVERALAYEIIRQTKVWKETGEAPEEQGTRGWDENEGKTFVQRVKEEANDYRYFPEPDIPELDFDKDWIEKLKAELPELPAQLRGRFQEQYGFNAVDAKIISQDRALASFIEETISELLGWLESSGQEGSAEEIWEKNKAKLSKLVSGWVLSKLLGALSKTGKELADITPENMAELITLIYGNKTNATNAVIILEEVLNTKTNPTEIMNAKDLGQMSDDGAVEAAVDKVISDNPKQVAEFKAGKEAVLQYLVGQVMKATRGKADAASAGQILKNKLS
ncbi:MAG: Asp-tRNA(Asn)/Glu-tRNA(Gln) amidotransferase subunit GatB, partial [Patescibacteria group bacterium]